MKYETAFAITVVIATVVLLILGNELTKFRKQSDNQKLQIEVMKEDIKVYESMCKPLKEEAEAKAQYVVNSCADYEQSKFMGRVKTYYASMSNQGQKSIFKSEVIKRLQNIYSGCSNIGEGIKNTIKKTNSVLKNYMRYGKVKIN
jgi:basic membrane lipoprotein Med (substrate-binding protein (PBP1-ABC) superfamily)